MLEYNGVTDTGTHATLFTVMGSHHLTQDSAGRPTLSLKLMVDAAFWMTVASARVTAAEMAAAWCVKKLDGEAAGRGCAVHSAVLCAGRGGGLGGDGGAAQGVIQGKR